MNNDTLTTETMTGDIETEATTEERLAQISAMIAAKQAETDQAEAPKAKLAPFTCPMDPAERALCDSCQ